MLVSPFVKKEKFNYFKRFFNHLIEFIIDEHDYTNFIWFTNDKK